MCAWYFFILLGIAVLCAPTKVTFSTFIRGMDIDLSNTPPKFFIVDHRNGIFKEQRPPLLFEESFLELLVSEWRSLLFLRIVQLLYVFPHSHARHYLFYFDCWPLAVRCRTGSAKSCLEDRRLIQLFVFSKKGSCFNLYQMDTYMYIIIYFYKFHYGTV